MDHLFLSMESNYQKNPMFIEDPVDVYLNSLPPGYRFAPTDAELILYYLQKKILKQELPLNKIREIDIYQHDPQYLAETQLNRHGEREWYFFTPRERKYPHGSRPNRTAHDGFWKVTGKDEVITSATGEIIGYKNTLDYFEGTHSENQKTKWKMHEYRLKKSERDEDIAASNNEKCQRDMKLDDCVLCKIYTSNRCKAGKSTKKISNSAKKSFNSVQDRDVQHENQDQPTFGGDYNSNSPAAFNNGYGSTNKFCDPANLPLQDQACGIAHPSGHINNFNNQNNTHYNMHSSSLEDHVRDFERWLITAVHEEGKK
ncbi:NAC domain-containing protein 2-like [Rosa chinensis]|uniref:NAC domain-containing protein 2-like n=1 Tax=Rosa chinensis TaxID=74649 RepID=UPI000D09547A|nr:NAC domain-containing protein 2-like [Rosa chinensis]